MTFRATELSHRENCCTSMEILDSLCLACRDIFGLDRAIVERLRAQLEDAKQQVARLEAALRDAGVEP